MLSVCETVAVYQSVYWAVSVSVSEFSVAVCVSQFVTVSRSVSVLIYQLV